MVVVGVVSGAVVVVVAVAAPNEVAVAALNVVAEVVLVAMGPHILHITGHSTCNLAPTKGWLHLSSQLQVPFLVGHEIWSSQTDGVAVILRLVVVVVATERVVVVMTVVVVVEVHKLHVKGHANCTFARISKAKQSQNPTNVPHMSLSSEQIVGGGAV